MLVRIFRPAKTAMQSGRANAKQWILEYEPQAPKNIDPLMGWVGSADTQSQVRLQFASCEEAVAYAKRMGYRYQISDKSTAKIKPKSYADNFRYDKLEFGRA